MKLLIATRNAHKLEEIRAILRLPSLELLGLDSFPDVPEVEEDGDTFEANAIKKAVEVALHTGQWTMADDSGLEVDALGGAPGVYSARYAGEPADYAANNRKLLSELHGRAERAARFRCVIAMSNPVGRTQVVAGACEGVIAEEARGAEGFGYDPLFVPDGYTETFAEMSAELKNSLSHRGKALMGVREEWGGLLASSGADGQWG